VSAPARGRTVVVGVGNPLMGDDAAGLETARLVAAAAPPEVELRESEAGGLELLDLLEGFDRAVVVDAMAGGPGEAGEVVEVELAASPGKAGASGHSFGLLEGMEICRRMGLKMPSEVRVFAVLVEGPFTFGAPLDEGLRGRLEAAAREIAEAVFGAEERCTRLR